MKRWCIFMKLIELFKMIEESIKNDSAYKSQIKSYVELLKDSCVLKQRSPLILHGMFDEFRTNPKRYKNPIELNPSSILVYFENLNKTEWTIQEFQDKESAKKFIKDLIFDNEINHPCIKMIQNNKVINYDVICDFHAWKQIDSEGNTYYKGPVLQNLLDGSYKKEDKEFLHYSKASLYPKEYIEIITDNYEVPEYDRIRCRDIKHTTRKIIHLHHLLAILATEYEFRYKLYDDIFHRLYDGYQILSDKPVIVTGNIFESVKEREIRPEHSLEFTGELVYIEDVNSHQWLLYEIPDKKEWERFADKHLEIYYAGSPELDGKIVDPFITTKIALERCNVSEIADDVYDFEYKYMCAEDWINNNKDLNSCKEFSEEELEDIVPEIIWQKWKDASKAEYFYNHLCRNIKLFVKKEKDALNIYKHDDPWSEFITSSIKENIKNSAIERALIYTYNTIIQKLNNIHYEPRLDREYYRIDNTLSITNTIKKDTETEIKIHNWKLLAAVEHENNFKDWTDELVKLVAINAPLKVVIGYGEYDDSNYYSKAINVANKIAEMQCFRKHIDAEDELILIMGPRGKDLGTDINNLADYFKMYQWSPVTNKFELYEK